MTDRSDRRGVEPLAPVTCQGRYPIGSPRAFFILARSCELHKRAVYTTAVSTLSLGSKRQKEDGKTELSSLDGGVHIRVQLGGRMIRKTLSFRLFTAEITRSYTGRSRLFRAGRAEGVNTSDH